MLTKSKSQLQQELQKLQQEKKELMESKAKAPSKFTKEQQAKLDAITEQVIDLEEQIELASDEQPGTGYKPQPGTENLAHLSIVKGRRFDENTGKEISGPYIQMFTYGEYKNFKKNAELIGYNIVEVLYNPFKD